MKKNSIEKTDHTELKSSEPHILVQIVKYLPQSVVTKTILKKITGNISAMSVATGETVAEKISPFSNFIQIIDGAAEIIIDKKTHQLKLGDGIIIPAHASHSIKANQQFKMISTIIKSGYEDQL